MCVCVCVRVCDLTRVLSVISCPLQPILSVSTARISGWVIRARQVGGSSDVRLRSVPEVSVLSVPLTLGFALSVPLKSWCHASSEAQIPKP